MCLQDSPLGIRYADLVSAFASGVNLAATWDRGLAFAQGAGMGSEHKGKGVDFQLGVRNAFFLFRKLLHVLRLTII